MHPGLELGCAGVEDGICFRVGGHFAVSFGRPEGVEQSVLRGGVVEAPLTLFAACFLCDAGVVFYTTVSPLCEGAQEIGFFRSELD